MSKSVRSYALQKKQVYSRVKVIHRLPQIHFGVERTQFYQNPLPHRLANLFKSSLIRHEMPVRGRVLEKPVSKATITLNITQNRVQFSLYISV